MRRDAKGGQVCKVDDGVVEPELVRHVSRVLLTAKRGRFPLLATVDGRQTIGAIHSSLTAQPLNSFPVTVNLDWVTHSRCSSTLFFFLSPCCKVNAPFIHNLLGFFVPYFVYAV